MSEYRVDSGVRRQLRDWLNSGEEREERGGQPHTPSFRNLRASHTLQGGQLLGPLLGGAVGDASAGFDIAALAGQLVGGGVAAAIMPSISATR